MKKENAKIGMRVIATHKPDNPDLEIGSTGTIVNMKHSYAGVCWDKVIVNGHSCDGTCPSCRGWELNYSFIKPLDNPMQKLKEEMLK